MTPTAHRRPDGCDPDGCIERKLALFPDDGRMVAEYELLPTETGWHLNVAALMSPDEYDGGDQPPMPSDGRLGPPG